MALDNEPENVILPLPSVSATTDGCRCPRCANCARQTIRRDLREITAAGPNALDVALRQMEGDQSCNCDCDCSALPERAKPAPAQPWDVKRRAA